MIQHFTTADFSEKVLENDKLVVIDFWAEWCGPCQALTPIIEDIAKEFEDNDNIVIGKLDVDKEIEIAQKYGVISIPVLKFFKNGEVVGEIPGLQSREVIIQKILELVGK